MGLTKPNNYSKTEKQFAQIATALAHPARNRIIEILKSEIIVTQSNLPGYLNLSISSVNQHLRTLKNARLLKNEYIIHYEVLKLNYAVLNEFNQRVQKLAENRDTTQSS
jgi:DNA-binding transcriptional ArsR family regulator